MKAVILTIGDEILIGQIINTNAAWIGQELTALGISVLRHVSVSDSQSEIIRALDQVYDEADIVILTGGLGPTHDDITKASVAKYFDVELLQDDHILEQVTARYRRRNIPMPESNKGQALVPVGFDAVMNTAGSAPALIRDDGNTFLALLPGVPHEMKLFVTNTILPRLKAKGGLPKRHQKTLLAVGIGESSFQSELKGIEAILNQHTSLAYLPNLQTLRLRLTTTGPNAEKQIEILESWIRSRGAKWIFGQETDTLEGRVGQLLLDTGNSIAVAESCTGGFISHMLTNVPGSSAYVHGGVVAYSNSVKHSQLGVLPATLESFGAVSRETACEMASGVRKALNASIGLSTTGILGPDGGTDEKPIGTVWIGISTVDRTFAIQQLFGKNRLRNKERVVTAALNLLRRFLLNEED